MTNTAFPTHPLRALSRWSGLALALSLTAAGPTLAQPQPAPAPAPKAPPERVELLCREQPSHQVVFGEAGQVSYVEQPPQLTEPVPVTISRPDAKAGYAVDAARIDSPRPELAAELAVWTGATQVDAGSGRLRIDLASNVLTLVEADSAGQARFRRFQCEPLAAAAPR